MGNLFSEMMWSFFISMLPVVELRLALPYALAHGISIWIAAIICIVGNLLPIPFILLFVRNVFNWLKKRERIAPIVHKIEARAFSKSKNIMKYSAWGLVLFVAIPLPGTGAWTGALIAALLDMRFKYAMPAIIFGVIIAAIIVSAVFYLVTSGVAPFLGWLIA